MFKVTLDENYFIGCYSFANQYITMRNAIAALSKVHCSGQAIPIDLVASSNMLFVVCTM